jgi:hypothetical protein
VTRHLQPDTRIGITGASLIIRRSPWPVTVPVAHYDLSKVGLNHDKNDAA